MTNAEAKLKYIIAHRGEPECETYLCKESQKLDAEIVEETLCHIWAGFYDAEIPQEELLAEKIRKNNNAIRRERKIADNREHQRRLKLRKGVIVNA